MKRIAIALAFIAASTTLHAAVVDDVLGVSSALGLSTPAAGAASAPALVATPAVSAAAMPPAAIPPGLAADYAKNLASDVFGRELFTGTFAQQGPTQFNPDYVLAVGDSVQVRLWGGYTLDAVFVVDPRGNVFLPHVGPVNVLGVRNQDLQSTVDRAVKRVFSANVFSYASLAAAQPVRVFVSGDVRRPGLYGGTSMDSLLHYIDLAGGIDPDRGSFLGVQVKRNGATRAEVNLYDFLLDGVIPMVQFADGDVIFVTPRRGSVLVRGLAQNAARFEFSGAQVSLASLARLARPKSQATHVRVVRNAGATRDVDYYPLSSAGDVVLASGDEVEYTADRKPGSITVRVEGETTGPQEFVLPYGARLGDLLQQVKYTSLAEQESVQLFRLSVQSRQKELLDASLRTLEATALTARSGTSDEATLRSTEAQLILNWIDRARKIVPRGQVYLAGSAQRDQLLLEDGDVLGVPRRDGLVLVNGEVMFPNAVAWDEGDSLHDYIRRAGGYTQNADASRVVIAHADGSFEGVRQRSWLFGAGPRDVDLRPGDEVLVLPKIDFKARQVTKDMTQILYQLAVSAKVILDL